MSEPVRRHRPCLNKIVIKLEMNKKIKIYDTVHLKKGYLESQCTVLLEVKGRFE